MGKPWSAELLLPEAVALRPVRFIGEEMRLYTAVTFPDNPRSGCELYLRRCRACGYLIPVQDADIIVDALDENGDIIQDFGISRAGFNYLYEKLKLRWEWK